MAYQTCEDCGTNLLNGICPNCSEELYIYNEQAEFLPDHISDEFLDLVKSQKDREKHRIKNKDNGTV